MQGEKRSQGPDFAALAGFILGMGALLPGWFTIKPNRLASGFSLGLVDSAGQLLATILFLFWIVCFMLSLDNSRNRALARGILGNIILVYCLLLAGYLPGTIVTGQALDSRISPDAGLWITLVAIYIIVFSAGRNRGLKPVYRNTIYAAGPLIFLALLFMGYFGGLSVLVEFAAQKARFYQEFWHHIYLVVVSLSAGTLLGIAAGIWATASRKIEGPLFWVINIVQTIPSLALFGLMIAPLSAISFQVPFFRDIGVRGIGDTPAIIALTIYSLLPIARNTFTGLQNVDRGVLDAGKGMGLSIYQVFLRIKAPLAAPLIVEGIRTSAVQCVGLAAVAALIGAGGLGWFIFQGLGQAAPDLILLGAIPIILLAVAVDFLMRFIARLARPAGYVESYDTA